MKGMKQIVCMVTASVTIATQVAAPVMAGDGCDPMCPNTASYTSAPPAPGSMHPNCGPINIAGATLFRDFYQSPASSNDFIDVDGDGCFGFQFPPVPPCGIVDQLAPLYTCPNWSGCWLLQWRSVGSVNGVREFIRYQLIGEIQTFPPGEQGILNRVDYAINGAPVSTGCTPCNDSNTPICPESIDLSIADIPIVWSTRPSATEETPAGAWNAKPSSSNYGYNNISSSTGYISDLPSLRIGQLALNTNFTNPDANTVYDTEVAFGPVAYVANRGTGISGLRITQLQHAFVAGRLPSGENLYVCTRSVGSGTRNAIMNTSGIDPSWGRGDNVGDEVLTTPDVNLGPGTQGSNCQGSSLIETAVQNRRLGLGYTGLSGPSRAASDALAGNYEVIDVMFDDRGGNQFVRPRIDTVLDNGNPSTGYQIGGNITFSSRGNPLETNMASPTYMANRPPAAFLNNITASIAAFTGDPPADINQNMPGEYLALTFFLAAGLDALPSLTDPTDFQPNPNFNQTLQDYIRNNNGLGIGADTPAYGAINAAGRVPRRNPNPDFNGDMMPDAYSDGSSNGNYANFSGALSIAPTVVLSQRNQLAGDFNNDGLRNWNDICDLIDAIDDPRGFVTAEGLQPGSAGGIGDGNYVIPEIIGDFNGDGNLDDKDARYFADGLALNPATGLLNRKEGFTRVDDCSASLRGTNNYFGTSLATGKPYVNGDSRGDVAGSASGPTAGAEPLGYDGMIDCRDIDYVYANFGDWSNLDEAVRIDLSCDMNGDLLVNQADVDELVQVILGTNYGDVNLDGVVDASDEAVVAANQGQTGLGWCGGDLNGDGIVDKDDLAFFGGNCGTCADSNCDGVVTPGDIAAFVAAVTGGEPGWTNWHVTNLGNPPGCDYLCANDADNNGLVTPGDIAPFVARLTQATSCD